MRERKRLGQILRDLQVLTEAEIERVVDAMRRRRDQTKFGQVARDMGLLRDEWLRNTLGVHYALYESAPDEAKRGVLIDILQVLLARPSEAADASP